MSRLPQPITAAKFRDRVPAQRATPRASVRHAPAGALPDCPVEALGALRYLVLSSIVATLREWRRRSASRRELARLDARTLRDIGLDPGVVDYELRQPFWRPLRNWRD
jgi:uncharacterized protein YjiS (DUF1127 family)